MRNTMTLSKAFIVSRVKEYNRKMAKSREHEQLAETFELEANTVRDSIPKAIFDAAALLARDEELAKKEAA
jgi:hypothetical protein